MAQTVLNVATGNSFWLPLVPFDMAHPVLLLPYFLALQDVSDSSSLFQLVTHHFSNGPSCFYWRILFRSRNITCVHYHGQFIASRPLQQTGKCSLLTQTHTSILASILLCIYVCVCVCIHLFLLLPLIPVQFKVHSRF